MQSSLYWTAHAYPTQEKLKVVERDLRELVVRLEVQTLLHESKENYSSMRSDAIFEKLARVNLSELKLKSNPLKVFSKSARNTFQKPIVFDGDTLPEMAALKRAMQHHRKLKKHLRPIQQYYAWSEHERVVFMLAQAQQFLDDDHQSVKFSQDAQSHPLEEWGSKAVRLEGGSFIEQVLSQMPSNEVRASTVYQVWHYIVLPRWIKFYSTKQSSGKYQCLLDKAPLIQVATQAGTRLWNKSDDSHLRFLFRTCKVIP